MAIRDRVHEGQYRFATRSEVGETRRAHRIESERTSTLWRGSQEAAGECRGRRAVFDDGSKQDIDAIVWATGYRSDFSWIDIPTIKDQSGGIIHRRGVTDSAGVFFIGLTWQHTRGSALVGFVNDDAAFIAGRIDSRLENRAGLVGTDSERT